MPYMYRGDYYRGDYYRGDFLGLGKLAKGLIGGIVGGVTGGPGGAIAGAVKGLTGAGGGSAPPRPPMGTIGSIPIVGPTVGGIINFFGGGSSRHPKTAPPGTPGYHPRKDGKGGDWVRNRHMNPTNVRALRRADRRAHSFLKIAKSVTRHYVAKQPKGRAYVSARRRKR